MRTTASVVNPIKPPVDLDKIVNKVYEQIIVNSKNRVDCRTDKTLLLKFRPKFLECINYLRVVLLEELKIKIKNSDFTSHLLTESYSVSGTVEWHNSDLNIHFEFYLGAEHHGIFTTTIDVNGKGVDREQDKEKSKQIDMLATALVSIKRRLKELKGERS